MRSEGYCSWSMCVYVCVCVSVCLLSHISPTERLFVLKTLSRTHWATKVKKFVGFSLKIPLLRSSGVTIVVAIFNPRRVCAARVTVLGSVCLSVKSHLT